MNSQRTTLNKTKGKSNKIQLNTLMQKQQKKNKKLHYMDFAIGHRRRHVHR